MAKCFVYNTMIGSQLAGLSKEACLYAGTDWLNLLVSQIVCQSEAIWCLVQQAEPIAADKKKKVFPSKIMWSFYQRWGGAVLCTWLSQGKAVGISHRLRKSTPLPPPKKKGKQRKGKKLRPDVHVFCSLDISNYPVQYLCVVRPSKFS